MSSSPARLVGKRKGRSGSPLLPSPALDGGSAHAVAAEPIQGRPAKPIALLHEVERTRPQQWFNISFNADTSADSTVRSHECFTPIHMRAYVHQ